MSKSVSDECITDMGVFELSAKPNGLKLHGLVHCTNAILAQTDLDPAHRAT